MRKMTIILLNCKSTSGKNNQLGKKNIKNIISREQQGVRDRKTVKICFSPARSVCMASPPCPNQAEHPSLGALRNWPLDENSWEREQGPFGCAPVALWGFLPLIYTGGCSEQHGHMHSCSICCSHRRGLQVRAVNPREGLCAQNPHNL